MTDIFRKAQKDRESMAKDMNSIKSTHGHFKNKVANRAAHEALMNKKVNAGAGRKLTAAESAFKTRGWPKADGSHPNKVSDKDRSEHQKKTGRAYHD